MASCLSLPDNYVSIDVECVATGYRHDERSVALVAVVNKHERVLLRKTVKPEKPVVSYLTPLTGLRNGDLDDGDRLGNVICEVKSLLGPNVVLVGQGVASDIKWLELKEGVDFHNTVDLGELFKGYNSHFGNFSYHSLQHEANTLLESGMHMLCIYSHLNWNYTCIGTISNQHDPTIDAQASIRLFKKYYNQPALLERAQQQLIRTRPPPSWAKQQGYKYEGICLAAYMPKKCTCGAPCYNK